MDPQSFVLYFIAGQHTSRSIPSRSDDTVPVAWAESSTVLVCVEGFVAE